MNAKRHKLEKSLRFLDGCLQSSIQDFLKKVNNRRKLNLDIGSSKKDAVESIKTGLKRKSFPADDLLHYIEELQHVTQEALISLEKFHLPLIRSFVRKENKQRAARLPVGGNRPQVLNAIKNGLTGKKFPPEDLVEYVDTLMENGFQHIFLFRLSEEHKDYLNELLKPEYIQKQLTKKNLLNRYNNPALISYPPSPQLGVVIHRPEVLLFKWVETRLWRQQVQVGIDENGNPLFKLQQFRERSINFFRLDLKNGESELCIQLMKPNPQKSLRQEWEIYCRRISELIPFDYFRPVLLEPIIRRLLTVGDIEIRSWKIALPEGGPLRGEGRPPTLLQKLKLFLRPFTGLYLGGYWLLDGKKKSKIRAILNGKTDELRIPRPATSNQLRAIIQRAHKLSSEIIETPELKKVAKGNGRRHAALQKLDIHLSRLKEKNIDMMRLIKNEWLTYDNITELLKEACAKFPLVFHVTYQVLCPKTKRPIEDAKGPIEYLNPQEIPNAIDCQHPFLVGKVKHLTKGNIRPTLHFKPSPPSIPEDGLVQWLVRHLGYETGSKATLAFFYLIFAVSYIGLVWISTRMFLGLIKSYSESVLPKLSFLIVILLLIVLLIVIIGRGPIQQAMALLSKLFIMAKDGILSTIKEGLEVIKAFLKLFKHRTSKRRR